MAAPAIHSVVRLEIDASRVPKAIEQVNLRNGRSVYFHQRLLMDAGVWWSK